PARSVMPPLCICISRRMPRIIPAEARLAAAFRSLPEVRAVCSLESILARRVDPLLPRVRRAARLASRIIALGAGAPLEAVRVPFTSVFPVRFAASEARLPAAAGILFEAAAARTAFCDEFDFGCPCAPFFQDAAAFERAPVWCLPLFLRFGGGLTSQI